MDKPTAAHHTVFVKLLQQLFHAKLEIVLVLDGARWPLKSATRTSRRNGRELALEKAKAAAAADDPTTADKFSKQAVSVPAEFVSWVIRHVEGTPGRSTASGTDSVHVRSWLKVEKLISNTRQHNHNGTNALNVPTL